MRKMKIVLLTLIMLLVLTGCQEKQTFTEFLLEQDFECEFDVCTESILDEGVDTVESYTWSSNKSSTYHEISDKFVINYVYTYLWDSGGTAVNTIDITIYIK